MRYGLNLAISTVASATAFFAAVSATDPSVNALAVLAAVTFAAARLVSKAKSLALPAVCSMTALAYCPSILVLAASGAVTAARHAASSAYNPSDMVAPIVVPYPEIALVLLVSLVVAVAFSLAAINTLAYKMANAAIAVSWLVLAVV